MEGHIQFRDHIRNVLSVTKYFSYQRKQEYCLWQTALSLTVQHRGGKGEVRLHGDGDGGSCDVGGNFAQHTWRPEHADVWLGVRLQRVRDAILKSPLYLPDILKWTQLHLISDCSFAVMF